MVLQRICDAPPSSRAPRRPPISLPRQGAARHARERPRHARKRSRHARELPRHARKRPRHARKRPRLARNRPRPARKRPRPASSCAPRQEALRHAGERPRPARKRPRPARKRQRPARERLRQGGGGSKMDPPIKHNATPGSGESRQGMGTKTMPLHPPRLLAYWSEPCKLHERAVGPRAGALCGCGQRVDPRRVPSNLHVEVSWVNVEELAECHAVFLEDPREIREGAEH